MKRVVLLVTLLYTLPAVAAETSWTASIGDWSTVSNWTPTLPTIDDDAYVQNGGMVNITQPGAVCDYLYLAGNVTMSAALTAGDDENVGSGGIGHITQTSGINSVLGLYLGVDSGGTYDLNGGSLSAFYTGIGLSSTGTFNQTNGTHSARVAFLGFDSGIIGYYNLQGGQLSISNEYVGGSGVGVFTQTGGTNTSTILCLSYQPGSDGTYTQNDGINTVARLQIGCCAHGTYNLNGGTLIVTSLEKGSGVAVFNLGNGTLQSGAPLSSDVPITLTGNGCIKTSDLMMLGGELSGTGGFTKLGSGLLVLSGCGTYTGDTVVNGGVLRIVGGYDGAARLIDVKSGAAVIDGVLIDNASIDVHTDVSAKFVVATGSHTIGNITGDGITQLNRDAELTVTSICQDTLTLAEGSTLTIAGIPGGPLGDRTSPVPEPSVIILICVAILSMALFSRMKVTLDEQWCDP
jgi:autotransporter-associated beta strand protein